MDIRRATLQGYDAGTHTATVQLDGSLAAYIDTIQVANNIAAAEMIAGRHVLLVWPDHANPDAAVIIAVYT